MKLGKSYFFVLAGVVLSGIWKESHARQIKLGVLLPWSGSWPLAQRMAEVIPKTIENINRNRSLLGINNLTFVWRDTRNLASQGLWAMVDLWKNEAPLVDAFIGPVFSVICEPCGLLAERLNLPMISWGCSSQRLSNKHLYPTFARTKTYGRTNPKNTSRAMTSVIRHFKWKRVYLFYSSETVWTDLALIMKSELDKSDIKTEKTIFSPWPPQNYQSLLLKHASEKARVFILLCYIEQATQIIMAAHNLNMTNGDYVFVTSDITMDTTHSNLSALDYYHQNSHVLDGIIDVSVNPVDDVDFQMYAEVIKREMQTPGSAFYSNATRHHEVSHFFAYASDAITLYALALNDTLTQGGNITDGRHVARNMFGKTFNGLSGVVSIDDKGDRVPSYDLRNLNNNSFVKIASILPSGLEVVENRTVVWFGGKMEVPLDEPRFHHGKEGHKRVTVWVAIPVVSIVLVLAMIATLLAYKRRNKIRSLSSVLIRYEDIDMIGCIGADNKAASSIMHSLVDFSVRSDRSSLHIPSESYAFIGRYKNRQVYVRKLAPNNLHLNHQIIKELYQVQRILHVNVNPILGVCIPNMTTPNMCIVSEACSRGSLLDVLFNDDIKLDLTFKMSFATDIASGMKALHASDIRYHGNLTSSNCLVDRTWGCRIGDYGLRRIRTEEKKFQAGNYVSPEYKVLLWTAPEHILDRKKGLFAGSQAGDVYSYGIILNEVFTRNEPFEYLRTLVPIQEIVRRILSSEKPHPLRPPTNNDICEKLISQCWDDDPSMRPNFSTIKNTLRKLNGGRSHRLVDTMLRKMEIYSNNLEELVEERTRQLEAEKARTDELLFEMLPRPVAEQLKAGKSVKAECFDQVTVFFSDIVGFTQLASSSTAFQVVTFLNDLYTYFDNIIHHYDVYKVETIGDAYMVVSGLPERNRDRHAGEIATMALHLLCDIRLFKIKHRPDTHPEMRIGIHSGPCVAGVVGVKKPRYDIFGDTVNVASRMESSGIPNRIHISRECRQVLMNLGGYHIERRGEIELKGKGRVITYFLNGKDSFNKTRPGHLESST